MKFIATITYPVTVVKILEIEADSMSVKGDFFVFKKGEQSTFLSVEHVISVSQEGLDFNLAPLKQIKPENKTNAKILSIVREAK